MLRGGLDRREPRYWDLLLSGSVCYQLIKREREREGARCTCIVGCARALLGVQYCQVLDIDNSRIYTFVNEWL